MDFGLESLIFLFMKYPKDYASPDSMYVCVCIHTHIDIYIISSVQSLSHVRLFATP